MKRTVLVFVAASTLLLPGCAWLRPFDPENPRVYVVPGVTGPHIIVDQEPIVITRKGRSKITWHVETKGYQFAPDGIQFDPKRSRGISGQVTGCAMVPKSGDLEFVCDNDNSGKGVHGYDINLVGPAGRIKVDPYVVND